MDIQKKGKVLKQYFVPLTEEEIDRICKAEKKLVDLYRVVEEEKKEKIKEYSEKLKKIDMKVNELIYLAAKKKKKILAEVEIEVHKENGKKTLVFLREGKQVFSQKMTDNEQIPIVIPPDEEPEEIALDVEGKDIL